MSWLNKLRPARIRTDGGNKRSIPEGLWDKCEGCGAVLYRPEVESNLYVCPKCSHHMPIIARDRLARSEEHTSELQSLMRISYAVFCLKKKKKTKKKIE